MIGLAHGELDRTRSEIEADDETVVEVRLELFRELRRAINECAVDHRLVLGRDRNRTWLDHWHGVAHCSTDLAEYCVPRNGRHRYDVRRLLQSGGGTLGFQDGMIGGLHPWALWDGVLRAYGLGV